MSEVKRYVWAGVHGLAEQQNGNWVSYIQYAALQQKLDAVLAENVLMLKLLTDISEQYQEVQTESEESAAIIDLDYISEVNTYVSRDVDGDNPFSATDSLLNAVRAEGGEMASARIRKAIRAFKDMHHGAVNECADIAADVASQLRAETDTTSSQYESLAGGK